MVNFDAQVNVDERIELEVFDDDVTVEVVTTTDAVSRLAIKEENAGYLTDNHVFNERERLSQVQY